MLKLPALPAFLKKAQSKAPVLSTQEAHSFALSLGLDPSRKKGTVIPKGQRRPPTVVQEVSRTVKSTPPVGSDAVSAERLPFTPPCIIGIEPWCWIDKLIPPSIEHKLFPYQFENVTMHILHLKMDGDVVTAFQNLSTPGQTVKTNTKTGATRDPQDVPGSADLTGWATELTKARDAGDEILSLLDKFVPVTAPGAEVHVSGTFEKQGIKSLLETLWGIFTTGQVATNASFDVKLEYQWMGETKTDERHVEMFVVAPVNGLDWSLF